MAEAAHDRKVRTQLAWILAITLFILAVVFFRVDYTDFRPRGMMGGPTGTPWQSQSPEQSPSPSQGTYGQTQSPEQSPSPSQSQTATTPPTSPTTTTTTTTLCGNTVIEGEETCDDGKHCADKTGCTTDTDCTDSSSCVPRSEDGCDEDCIKEVICCRPGDPSSCKYLSEIPGEKEGDERCNGDIDHWEGAFSTMQECHDNCPECGNLIIENREDCDDGKHCEDGTSCNLDSDCNT